MADADAHAAAGYLLTEGSKAASRWAPDRCKANSTAHPRRPDKQPKHRINSNVGKNVKCAGWIGPTCGLEGGTEFWMAVAFSMASTTPARMIVISVTVALGKRNSVCMEYLLEKIGVA